MIRHLRMSGSGFKLPPVYLRPLFSVADRVHCSTLESSSTSPMTQTCPPTIQRSPVPKGPEKLRTMPKWKAFTRRATGIVILECLLMLLAKLTAIPTPPEMVIATATAIPARFMIAMRIATSTTIMMPDPKKLDRSCIVISPSALLSIEPSGNPTWSL